MAAPINFESASLKDEEKRLRRQQKKVAQAQYLEKVKLDHEKNERKKEEARKRGEDTWMLPSLNERIEQDSKKKKKKHKKEKKKKKKHKKGDKNTASDSDSGDEWIEKDAEPEPMETPSTENQDEPAGPLKRDDWLMAGESFVPTFSRDDLRAKIKADKEEKQRELQQNSAEDVTLNQPGVHHLELNPFWKDGGTGLPEVEKEWTAGTSGIGDGGVGWLKKALSRVEQQAREDGRSLEELAAEKWGSLKTIKKIIADAEAAELKCRNDRQNKRRSRLRDRDESFRKRSRSRDGKRKSRSRSRERQRKRRHSSGSSDSDSDRDFNQRRRRSRSRSRSPKRRSRSRSPNRRNEQNRSRFLKPGEMDSSRSTNRSRFRKPDDDDSKPRFRKPDDQSGARFRKPDYQSESRSRKPDDQSESRFRKPDDQSKSRFRKPDSERESTDRSQSGMSGTKTDSSRATGWKKPEAESSRSQSPRQVASSSSSSSSSEEELVEAVEEAPRILTEEELNVLGAKLVKAELMGDDDRAAELKVELDAARQAAASTPRPAAPRPPRTEEPETVVLTKTSKTGLSMPLGAAQNDMWGGRKAKKKKKVATHTKGGERERYFADDDKFTLKQMFQREKLGTAEDSNKMFARLAGRGVEKTDDEYQIDDAYLKRATGEQSEAQLEQQDRAEAISQHNKMSQALEKCQYCLDKCAKHLIIAIGVKSYVSLPASVSLTEGHCQIIPIEHCPCATKLDEDVWKEMQVFRQTLTKMFLERDEDCVFMETALGVNRHPHMIIECIPVPRETGDMAPIYFKKAIQEHGDEWAQNRKLVDISRKDIRHSVPRGFPYFSVDFGLQGGFAHVIEDEQTFSRFFGKEIIGGMLDIEPRLWRKGQRQNFDDQRKKVMEFSGWWKPYDWTVTIKKKD